MQKTLPPDWLATASCARLITGLGVLRSLPSTGSIKNQLHPLTSFTSPTESFAHPRCLWVILSNPYHKRLPWGPDPNSVSSCKAATTAGHPAPLTLRLQVFSTSWRFFSAPHLPAFFHAGSAYGISLSEYYSTGRPAPDDSGLIPSWCWAAQL